MKAIWPLLLVLNLAACGWNAALYADNSNAPNLVAACVSFGCAAASFVGMVRE